MVTDVKTYSFYIVYWFVSIAFVIMVIFYRAVILNCFKRLIAICVKSYYGLTFMAAVVIWSIYGFVSKQYMSGVTDYFAGFKNLDIFLLLYLFYQMPIWALLYYFLTKNFSFYYIQYALRKGNAISWMKHLAIIFLVCTYLYYGVGMIVIAFISGMVINANLIIEMSNMILQTIVLLLLVFLCWLHEAGDKHIGFIIITICHIVAGTLFSWLPLTQGLYISHMTSQPECMVFQMAECLVIGLGVVVMLKNKQEDIILRKWKAENI